MTDFSCLPEIVWVKILSYLSLPEKGVVALTCHALNEACHHPSLWYTAKIQLLASANRQGFDKNVLITRQQLALVKKFGKYFQDLDLTFRGYISSVPDNVLEVLEALTENCRYETLTLTAGTALSKRAFYWEQPMSLDIDDLTLLVEKAYRLKTLNILAWPMYRNVRYPDILKAVRKNEANKSITSLNLFYRTAEETTWATLNAELPPPKQVLTTIRFCENLTILKLQSTMLDSAIIQEFSKKGRCPLERLSVLVTYSRHNDQIKVPEIDSNDWANFKDNCPEVKVDFTFVTRMPFIEKSSLLKPEIPVASLNFMKYSECSKEDLISIKDKFSHCLVKFCDFSSGARNADQELLSLVESCKHMTYFIYNGEMNHHTVIALAKLRGSQWYRFGINSQNINTTPPQDPEEENQVLFRNSDGALEYTSRRGYQDDLEKEAILEVMIQEVGMHLSLKWLPMDLRDQREELTQRLYNNKLI